MTQKQRVPKGEEYWLIRIDVNGVKVYCHEEGDWESDKRYFEDDNYFHTKEEAEATARKLRSVLKGADVIEMPESNEVDMIQREIGLEVGGEDEELVEAASLGAIKMINWLIDKIVK